MGGRQVSCCGLASALYISCAFSKASHTAQQNQQDIKIATPQIIFNEAIVLHSGCCVPSNYDAATRYTKVDRYTWLRPRLPLKLGAIEKLPGVSKVISGYTGGKKENPNYKEVATGSTDHVEAIEIHYDSSTISYNDLLEVLWRNRCPSIRHSATGRKPRATGYRTWRYQGHRWQHPFAAWVPERNELA